MIIIHEIRGQNDWLDRIDTYSNCILNYRRLVMLVVLKADLVVIRRNLLVSYYCYGSRYGRLTPTEKSRKSRSLNYALLFAKSRFLVRFHPILEVRLGVDQHSALSTMIVYYKHGMRSIIARNFSRLNYYCSGYRCYKFYWIRVTRYSSLEYLNTSYK